MMTSRPHPHISVQWHITTLCGNRCRHCYMQDEPTHQAEKAGSLDYTGMLRVLDGFCEFEAKWGAVMEHFTLSGGDPLLYPKWRDFIRELRRRGKRVSLLGNPETLNEETAAFLAEWEIQLFQMSLDGMRKTHDYFRAPGSFDRTLGGLELLERFGLNSNIMFTLFPTNQEQLIPLMRHVAEQTPASSFSFDLGCQVGAAAGLPGGCFDQSGLRRVLTGYLEEKRRLKKKGLATRLAEKSNLLKLIRFGQQDFYPLACDDSPVVSGCYAGWTAVSLLSDGTVLACRRFPLPVGKMPEQSFEDIFLGSELMKKFRRAASFKGCGTCDFYQVCRGCPALVHGLTGDPFAANPVCFRDQLPATRPNHRLSSASPPMDLDLQAEFDLLASMFPWRVRDKLPDFLHHRDFLEVYAVLTMSREERTRFMADPANFARQGSYGLDNDQLVFLVRHFNEEPWRFKGKGDPRLSARERFAAAVFANLAAQEEAR